MPRIDALCTSARKGTPKRPVQAVRFRQDHGIEGDAHAGPGHRQVSLLATEDIEEVRRAGLPDIPPGAFAENVVVSGLDLAPLGLGTRLRLGETVRLEVTQIGKVCHTPCAIGRQTGRCVMPERGLFARVLAGGTVGAGDPLEVLSLVPRDRFQAVVLTVSDRCAAGQATDTAGPAAGECLETGLGAHLYATEILPDDRDRIVDRLRHHTDTRGIDLVATVGGTGFAPRDVTPEATRAVVERPAPGLDEAMRAASLAKTPHAALSRGGSGLCGRTLILNLPGSEKAAVENLRAVLPALAHGLRKLRGDPEPCGQPRRKTGADQP